MRLTDFDPRWVLKDGRRVGFIFRSPTNSNFWQSCFFAPTPESDQHRIVWECLGGDDDDHHYGRSDVQSCKDGTAWRCNPPPAAAAFSEISIPPSLDGSLGGLWHGHILKGQIAGGI